MPKVTVLIPIYNASKYLRQALDSTIHQTLSDLEIICLNDGSTDDSAAILAEYQQRDKRIIVIDKPNTGYGDTMNQGIQRAQGEYIGILEPDDYLDPSAFEKLCQLAHWHQADIVKANFYRLENDVVRKNAIIRPQDTGKIFCPCQDQAIFRLPPAIWSAIYRREFLLQNQIDFLPTPGASYQDLGFNIKALALAKRVVLTDNAYLYYRVDNVNSSSNSSGKLTCAPQEYASIEEFLRQHQLMEKLGPAIMSAKFGNYLWNLQRLPVAAARKFYQTMLSEFRSAKAAGLLRRSAFRPKYWLILQAMLRFPRSTENFLIKHKS